MSAVQRDAMKYDIEVDLGAENTSHRQMVEMIGANKRVLDVGCSTGYLAKTLVAFGNRVTGIEYDPAAATVARAHAEQVHVADLDQAELASIVAGEVFDVVVFGDVLEHLRDPLPTLRQARRVLAPGGYVVISIPNVAHGDVRMSLMLGRFPYRNLGLLDATHLRFFTRSNLQELLNSAGFAAIEVRTTTAPLFGTEVGVQPDEVDPSVAMMIGSDPDSLVYQFVLTAVPQDATTLAAETAWENQQLKDQVVALKADLASATTRLTELVRLQEHVVALESELEDTRVRLARAESAERELNALRATRTLRTRSATLRMMGRA